MAPAEKAPGGNILHLDVGRSHIPSTKSNGDVAIGYHPEHAALVVHDRERSASHIPKEGGHLGEVIVGLADGHADFHDISY